MALGRGLDALFGEIDESYENEGSQKDTVSEIPVKDLRPNPFLNEYSSYYPELEHIGDYFKLCQKLFIGTKDFGGFCKTPDKVDNTICNIKDLTLYANVELSQYSIEMRDK